MTEEAQKIAEQIWERFGKQPTREMFLFLVASNLDAFRDALLDAARLESDSE